MTNKPRRKCQRTNKLKGELIFGRKQSDGKGTRHNSADSVPTSNLVCIKEVAIRTTFCIAGIIYYTCNLVIDIQKCLQQTFLTNCVSK